MGTVWNGGALLATSSRHRAEMPIHENDRYAAAAFSDVNASMCCDHNAKASRTSLA